MQINFVVPGRPVPMARPRVTARGTYTPRKSAAYKRVVSLVAKKAMRGKKPLEGALVCRIELYFDIPTSYTKGRRMAARYNIQKPIGKNTGDADNHAKAVLDALKGICWNDDSQVTKLIVTKRYTDTGANAEVWIFPDDKEIEMRIIKVEAGQ